MAHLPETVSSTVRGPGTRLRLAASGKPYQQTEDDDRKANRADHPPDQRILAFGKFFVPLGHVRPKTLKRGADIRFQGFHFALEQFVFEASNGF